MNAFAYRTGQHGYVYAMIPIDAIGVTKITIRNTESRVSMADGTLSKSSKDSFWCQAWPKASRLAAQHPRPAQAIEQVYFGGVDERGDGGGVGHLAGDGGAGSAPGAGVAGSLLGPSALVQKLAVSVLIYQTIRVALYARVSTRDSVDMQTVRTGIRRIQAKNAGFRPK